MSKSKFPKSVSFNLKNTNDQAILNYVKKRNFSGFVKKLILADMRKNNVDVVNPTSVTQTLSKLERLQRTLESAKEVNSNSQSNSDK